jgi:hypothetical protein
LKIAVKVRIMRPAWVLSAPESRANQTGVPVESSATVNKGNSSVGLLIIALIVVAATVGLVSAFRSVSSPSTTVAISSAYFRVSASSIISSVVQQRPAGYVSEESKPGGGIGGNQIEDWAELDDSSGSLANMRLIGTVP